jgi:hypothetical protein
MAHMMPKGLEEGFTLDRQWFWLRGEMERTKRPALLALARVFVEARVPYTIIGGVALQVHQSEPRTTLDIGVAVATYGALPRARLEAAGFTHTGQFSHSENWLSPEGTPMQFTDDPALAGPISRADEIELEEVYASVSSVVPTSYMPSSEPPLIRRAVAPSACRISPTRKPSSRPSRL